MSHVAALLRFHTNDLKPFEIELRTETIPPSPKTISAIAVMTNGITSLRELLHYQMTCQLPGCDWTTILEKNLKHDAWYFPYRLLLHRI